MVRINKIKINFLLRVTASLCLIFATSCGGGGGGGGDTHDDSIFTINNTGKEFSQSGVRFIHAVTDGSPVQIASDGKVSAGFLRYTFSNFLNLSKKTYDIEQYLTNEPIKSVNISYDKRATLLYCGSKLNQVQRVMLLQNETGTNDGAIIRGVHALFGAEGLKFVIGNETLNTSFCDATDYVSTPAGNVTLSAYRVSDGRQVAQLSLPLEEGNAYSFVVAGDISDHYTIKVLRD